MKNHEKLLLDDALKSAIEYQKTIKKYNTIICILLVINAILSVLFAFLLLF